MEVITVGLIIIVGGFFLIKRSIRSGKRFVKAFYFLKTLGMEETVESANSLASALFISSYETGAFKTNLGRLRVTFAFSTRVLLQALIQYNDVTDNVSTNLRFSWLGAANTGLFLVYNEIAEFGSLAKERPNRSLILKYSRLFNVFR